MQLASAASRPPLVGYHDAGTHPQHLLALFCDSHLAMESGQLSAEETFPQCKKCRDCSSLTLLHLHKTPSNPKTKARHYLKFSADDHQVLGDPEARKRFLYCAWGALGEKEREGEREREIQRERERGRRKWRHHNSAEICDDFALFLAKFSP